MSVSIGSGATASSSSDTSALYRQLKADQTALQNAEKQNAAQAVIAADEARVAADQQAIATADASARQSATGQAATGETELGQTATRQTATGQSASGQSASGQSLYL